MRLVILHKRVKRNIVLYIFRDDIPPRFKGLQAGNGHFEICGEAGGV